MFKIEVIEIAITPVGFVLILSQSSDSVNTVLPIFIAQAEMVSISSILNKESNERPVTHDFIFNFLSKIKYKISKVVIDDFKDGTFYSKIYIQNQNNEIIEIEARPSDAIALALRFKASIYVHKNLYQTYAIKREILQEKPIEPINLATGSYSDTTRTNDDEDDQNKLFSKFFEEIGIEDENSNLIKTILEAFQIPFRTKKITTEPTAVKTEEEVLQQMLDNAVYNEKYELAAKLRDELASEFPKKKKRKKKL